MSAKPVIVLDSKVEVLLLEDGGTISGRRAREVKDMSICKVSHERMQDISADEIERAKTLPHCKIRASWIDLFYSIQTSNSRICERFGNLVHHLWAPSHTIVNKYEEGRSRPADGLTHLLPIIWLWDRVEANPVIHEGFNKCSHLCKLPANRDNDDSSRIAREPRSKVDFIIVLVTKCARDDRKVIVRWKRGSWDPPMGGVQSKVAIVLKNVK